MEIGHTSVAGTTWKRELRGIWIAARERKLPKPPEGTETLDSAAQASPGSMTRAKMSPQLDEVPRIGPLAGLTSSMQDTTDTGLGFNDKTLLELSRKTGFTCSEWPTSSTSTWRNSWPPKVHTLRQDQQAEVHHSHTSFP